MKRAWLIVLLTLALAPLALGQSAHSVVLNWGASSTPNVTYNVYRSTITGGPYSQINMGGISVLTFTDSAVSNGTTYFYVVRAFDGTTESANSNEAKAVIPQAPTPPTTLTATVK